MARRILMWGACLLILLGTGLTFLGDKSHLVIWFAHHRHPWSDQFFYHVTKLGEPPGFIMIGLLLWFRSWRKMLVIPLIGGVVTVVSYVLKNIFEHERPTVYLRRMGWEGPMGVMDYHLLTGFASFPSGHSMAAWALFTLTACLIRKTWVSLLCLFLAASVSISRVYLMAHFLRDVIAGAVVGFILGYLAWYLFDRWNQSQPIHSVEDITRAGDVTA